MQEDTRQADSSKDEVRLLIEEGVVLRLQGTLDRNEAGRQLVLALACSALLGGQAVLMIDWLPGLTVTCRAALNTDSPAAWNWRDEWSELHSRIRWWLEQPSTTAPKTYTLQTAAGLVRFASCDDADDRSDDVMRLIFDWHVMP